MLSGATLGLGLSDMRCLTVIYDQTTLALADCLPFLFVYTPESHGSTAFRLQSALNDQLTYPPSRTVKIVSGIKIAEAP